MPTPERVTPQLLRGWPLPEPGASKKARGDVLVVGGSLRSPGAAVLAGRAALRVGAGRLTLAVGAGVAAIAAVSVPESGVVPLAQARDGRVRASGLRAAKGDLRSADAVLVGPGLDHAGETADMLRLIGRSVGRDTTLVLDAYALGALAGSPRLAGRGPRVLTPNREEARRLLGRPLRTDAGEQEDVLAIARRYGAVVTCYGLIASPDGRLLRVADGGPGLGTSGSGDALAGAIAGLAARGCPPLQAAVWGTCLHAAAGESLAERIAPLGFLASEIVDRLAHELAALSG